VLQAAHRRRRVEQTNHVKTKGSRELKAWQHQDLAHQPAILIQARLFIRAQALRRFPPRQVLDLADHGRVPGDRVVICKS